MFVAAHNGARIWGGAERATTRLLAGLQERGHRVLLYCNRPLVAGRAAEMGVTTRLLPIGGDMALPHAFRFAASLRDDGPDALIVGTYKKLFYASLGARMAGIPRVIARVGLESDVPRSWKYRVALRRWVDGVVVTAGQMRAPFEALLGTDGRVLVIPNAVAAAAPAVSPATARAELGLAPDSRVIGAVARLDTQKRLDRFLRAFARLPADVAAVIAGDGPERTSLEMLARDLGVADRVRFLGHREDTGLIYPALDLMVVSSDREGMSNAMLEALAAGVPVVSTPVSGAAEALAPLPDGRWPGQIVADFTEEALLTAITSLLSDRTLLSSMGRAAVERAGAEFSFAGMLDRWEAILTEGPALRSLPASPQ